MPGPNNPYIYKPEDNPLTVANQFGLTPDQLLKANPGGFPFTTGQAVNIPAMSQYQYAQPIGPQPAPSLLQQRMEQGYGYDLNQRGRGTNANVSNLDMRGRGFGQPDSVDQINAMRGRTTGVTNNLPMQTGVWEAPAFDPSKPYGGFAPAGPDNKDYANTAAARYYEAAGTPFLQQQRWDPQARRYVSLGKLLKQGKLDLQGNWNRRSRRQRQTNNAARRQQQKAQQSQDFTLANSLISFNASSG